MTVTNKFGASTHWKKWMRLGDSPSRNKSRYVCSMNPGKPKGTAIPMQYVMRAISLVDMDKTRLSIKRGLKRTEVLVNDTRCTSLKMPVNLLDVIKVKDGNSYKSYLLVYKKQGVKAFTPFLEPIANDTNTQYFVRSYKLGKGKNFIICTFQGKNFTILNTPENVKLLRSIGAMITSDSNDHKLSCIDLINSEYVIMKLTGKEKFTPFKVLDLKKVQSETSNLYHLTLLSGQKKKQITIGLKTFRQKYVIIKKAYIS